jgi:acetyl-CoA C-acetyltransferase
MERAKIDPNLIDHVILGMGAQYSPDSMIGGRAVGLKAGVPIGVPAFSINKICASSVQSVVCARNMILLNEADFVLCAGAESLSQAPFLLRGIRGGVRINQNFTLENSVWETLQDPVGGTGTGEMADRLAKKYNITREESDRFAYESQMKATAATESGRLAEEIVPIEIKKRGETTVLDKDTHIRPDTTLESLSKLRPGWTKDGVVTGGNASGIVDGGAACIVSNSDKAKEYGLDVMGRIVSWGSAGVDPLLFGIGPVPATEIALKRAGLTFSDLDLLEVNEAFSTQVLADLKLWGKSMDDVREKLNVNGGAVALGHPFGATGIRMILTLLLELKKRKERYGLVTMCIGGGQGMAMIVENVNI